MGIRANQVAAGYVDTDMTSRLPEIARQRFPEASPLKRLPATEETGQTLHAGGGIMETFL